MSATQTAPATPLLQGPLRDELAVEHLLDMEVELQPAQVIPTATGTIMNFVADGGSFQGPRLQGEVLRGGGDGLIVGSDQIGRVDVRATLRTEDGVLIQFTAGGVIRIAPDGLERLAAGERLPYEQTYVRTTPRLESADERYAWLAEHVLVGLNELSKDHIDYRVYRLK